VNGTIVGTRRKDHDDGAGAVSRMDTEVSAKATRRRYTAEYKLRIIREADACTKPGDVGALLRREGLYSSLLTTWRRAMAAGALGGLEARRRGPKKKPEDLVAKRVAELERENAKLKKRLEDAELIITFQKKLAEMLRPKDGGPENNGRSR
jgi:transposase